MRLLMLGALALAAETVNGYLDTSPFFMFSTSELLNAATKISTASAITSEISQSLSHCPSNYYILVSQPGVTADDYRSQKTHTTLAHRLAAKPHSSIRSSVSIPEVIGEIDLKALANQLTQNCDIEHMEIDALSGAIPTSYAMKAVITVHLPIPSASQRQEDLSQNDALIASLLDMIPSGNYTLLYTATPGGRSSKSDSHDYVMTSDIQDSLHMDLKRNLGANAANGTSSNYTLIDGPLFHRYQFFTPGIFMGFLVGFILLMILYVGLSALSSLQVTYAAFDKEQGQLAARKLQ